jgi:polysaccharide export outer membrane protein
MRHFKNTAILAFLAWQAAGLLAGGDTDPVKPKTPSSYLLGPGDMIGVNVLDLEELDDRKARVDLSGDVNLPSAGRVHAAGLTTQQLEAKIAQRLQRILQEPTVTVSIEEFRSQPVSVLGAVGTPGVVQLQGRKSLFEVLSLAGGLKADAGNTVVLTRQKEWGPIPIPNAKQDPSGQFNTAELNVKSIMSGRNPQENILIQPDDVISVPKAELVYVIGAVKKPGGFVLNERENISVLQALSLAEGLDRAASPKTAKVLHAVEGTSERTEIAVDVRKILEGKTGDVPLAANDILFIPTSAAKNAAIRGAEAALQIGTGIAIYRR